MANTARSNLDRIFSTFIRMRDRGQCYTCPRKGDIRDFDYPYWNTVYKEKVKDMSQVLLA